MLQSSVVPLICFPGSVGSFEQELAECVFKTCSQLAVNPVRLADASELLDFLRLNHQAQTVFLLFTTIVNSDLIAMVKIYKKRMRLALVLVPDSQVSPEIKSNTKLFESMINVSPGVSVDRYFVPAIKKSVEFDFFGIEKYLRPGIPVYLHSLSRSFQKDSVIEELVNFVTHLEGIPPQRASEFARRAGEVLDEFLMNAIWDANPQKFHKERASPIFLKTSELVEVAWTAFEQTLVLAVVDLFGSLDKETMLKYFESLQNPEPSSVGGLGGQITLNQQGPSGGIGIHLVLRRCEALVVNLHLGQKTEFLAFFNLSVSPASHSKLRRSLHVFCV